MTAHRTAHVLLLLGVILLCELASSCSGFQPPSSFGAHRPTTISTTNRHPTTTSHPLTLAALPLPACTAAQVGKVALTTGSIGLLSQLALTQLFRKHPSPMLKDNAAYTAHNVVALGLMLTVSYIGVVGWCLTPHPTTQPLLQQLPAVRWLGGTITGMFCLWDIPISLAVKELRNNDVLAHHCVMALVAWLAATRFPVRYLFFYLGVSELSSLPLICYDQLNVLWNASSDNTKTQQVLEKWRDQAQLVAALTFTWIRALWFAKVTLGGYLPDTRRLLLSGAAPSLRGVAWIGVVGTLGFTALQWIWFSRMLQAVFKGKQPPIFMNREATLQNGAGDNNLKEALESL